MLKLTVHKTSYYYKNLRPDFLKVDVGLFNSLENVLLDLTKMSIFVSHKLVKQQIITVDITVISDDIKF